MDEERQLESLWMTRSYKFYMIVVLAWDVWTTTQIPQKAYFAPHLATVCPPLTKHEICSAQDEDWCRHVWRRHVPVLPLSFYNHGQHEQLVAETRQQFQVFWNTM